jgi:hypothetical protein
MYAYYVRTVTKFRMVLHTTRYANNAQEIVDELTASEDFKRIDVAPASPVNGYEPGLPIRSGDVAWAVK